MVNSTLENGEVVNILLCRLTTLRNFVIYIIERGNWPLKDR